MAFDAHTEIGAKTDKERSYSCYYCAPLNQELGCLHLRCGEDDHFEFLCSVAKDVISSIHLHVFDYAQLHKTCKTIGNHLIKKFPLEPFKDAYLF